MYVLPEGYSMVEILWEVSEGDVGIRALRWVHPKRITFWEIQRFHNLRRSDSKKAQILTPCQSAELNGQCRA